MPPFFPAGKEKKRTKIKGGKMLTKDDVADVSGRKLEPAAAASLQILGKV